MTGNQYFWLLIVVVLVYSAVGIMEKWVRSKEAEAQMKMIEELIDQNERIHKENMVLIEAINEITNRASKQGVKND